MPRLTATHRVVCVVMGLLAIPFRSSPASDAPFLHDREVLTYSIEWRLIPAGTVQIEWLHGPRPGDHRSQANLHLESIGLISKFFKISDDYSTNLDEGFCVTSTLLRAQEGSRRRDSKTTFDRNRGKAYYWERDMVKGTTLTKEIDVPHCVHDVLGGLYNLRTLPLDPGRSTDLPVSDGKRSVSAHVEAQEREQVKTPAGTFKTIRYQANLFNNVLYRRKGQVFIWLTDDTRRLPVQIRIRLQIHIGTITLQLEKEEKS